MFKRVNLILHFYNVKVTSPRCFVDNYIINYMKSNSRIKGKKKDEINLRRDNTRLMNRKFQKVLREKYDGCFLSPSASM